MRLLLAILFIFFTNVTAKAQIKDLLRGSLDLHAGYSAPLGNNYPINGGFSLGLEPKFWINKEIMGGVKLGTNLLKSPAVDVTLAPLNTLMLVGEKYHGEGDFTFYYGAAAGLYLGGQTKKIGKKPTELPAAKQVGFTPRAGIQFGPLRLMAEYHIRPQQAKFVSIMLGYSINASQ
jgi:hypothetical protein